jgi:peptidoglycan/LPS O-acetylase OafA/YrhL
VHQPLIYTVGTGLFMVFVAHMGYNKSVVLAFLCTIPVVAIMTLLFHKYIEQPSMKIASFSQEVFVGERDFSFKQKYDSAREYIVTNVVRRLRPQNVQDSEVE